MRKTSSPLYELTTREKFKVEKFQVEKLEVDSEVSACNHRLFYYYEICFCFEVLDKKCVGEETTYK